MLFFNLSYYLNHPLEILQIWNGGLAIHGGIIAGLLFIIYYCKKHKVNLMKMLDIIVVGLIIAQAIGRWGNSLMQKRMTCNNSRTLTFPWNTKFYYQWECIF